MIVKLTIIIFCLHLFGCNISTYEVVNQKSNDVQIACSNKSCIGTYAGPEFINGDDVAHQLSNQMSKKVGDQLKKLYKDSIYSKVDFTRITMTTIGMGSGKVEFKLTIPFIRVKEKCAAYTSFDHVGGWNHSPALSSRIKQLQKALIEGESLDISELKSTDEGLQEYWIQWKNKVVQSDCNKRHH